MFPSPADTTSRTNRLRWPVPRSAVAGRLSPSRISRRFARLHRVADRSTDKVAQSKPPVRPRPREVGCVKPPSTFLRHRRPFAIDANPGIGLRIAMPPSSGLARTIRPAGAVGHRPRSPHHRSPAHAEPSRRRRYHEHRVRTSRSRRRQSVRRHRFPPTRRAAELRGGGGGGPVRCAGVVQAAVPCLPRHGEPAGKRLPNRSGPHPDRGYAVEPAADIPVLRPAG